MIDRLPALVELSEVHETKHIGAPRLQWIFRPVGPHRRRLFFLWVDEEGELGGTRCRDDHRDPAEPWQYHAYLPREFLRVMASMLPPEEVAKIARARLTRDYLTT